VPCVVNSPDDSLSSVVILEDDLGDRDEERVQIVTTRTFGDRVFRGLATSAGVTTFLVMGLIGGFLLIQGFRALRVAGWAFFTETQWLPDQGGAFGIGAVVLFTVQIALVALVVAVPLSITTALFITEYAPPKLRRFLTSAVDLLAAVPSLIYGLWGFFFLQPRIINLSKWMADHLGFVPFFRVPAEGDRNIGLFPGSTFIAGVVVSLMVIPICTAVMREVFSQAPAGEKEGALALGGTRWGVVRHVVLPFGRGGIIGGSMLGLGRALGETIAVTLILSVSFEPKVGILEQGSNSIAALIALKFSESNDLGISALMAAGLALFVITLVVNTLASVVVARSRSGEATEI
jgi:phosphate transport system permease protein